MYQHQASELPTDLGHLTYDEAMENLVSKLQWHCCTTKIWKEKILSHRI